MLNNLTKFSSKISLRKRDLNKFKNPLIEFKKISSSNKIKIALVFNSRNSLPTGNLKKLPQDFYVEWDDYSTIEAIKNALVSEKHSVYLVDEPSANDKIFLNIKPDIVFNIAEGLSGFARESKIPAILEKLNIPYTGSDTLTLAIALDKAKSKELMNYANIKNPIFLLAFSEKINHNLKYPVIVKPNFEGSSKGISNNSIANNQIELKNRIKSIIKIYNQPALVEEYLPGREFTVAIIGNYKPIVLPIVEIKFDELPHNANKIYSYEAKWVWDKPDNPLNIFECPAKTNTILKSKIEDLTIKTFKLFKCRDFCRIDIRLDSNNEPNIIEINPLPGLLPNPKDNSCFPKAACAFGWNYNTLITNMLKTALKRYNML